MTVTVYTANIGNRDVLRPPVEQSVEVDWVYFTDSPDVLGPRPWRTVVVAGPAGGEHPNMRAKWFRTHPPVDGPADRAVWIDANMQPTCHTFVEEALRCVDGEHRLAVWAHPRRDCIYDEIDASLDRESQGGRYDRLPLREQGAAYRAEGYPAHHGLYATGTLVWTVDMLEFGHAWYEECRRWGYQDQVSFPVVLWRHGIVPATFPVVQTRGRFNHRQGWWGNSWMKLWTHREGTGL